jgi:oligopeptide/dipeptide ABC transporter ATP-binding protein
MALLEVSHLVKHYEKPRGTFGALGRRPRQYVKAVDDISFSIEPGEMLALVGESGCGKTTTAETVLRVIEPTSGTVTLNGTDLTALSEAELRPLRRHMQIVYQDPYASLDPRFRVSRTIEEPLAIHGIGGSKRARRQLVSDALTQVELVPTNLFLDRFPHELSGGQRQRVAIATALAVNPELLIADEPVSMLDVSVRAGIMALLSRLCRERGMGILLITHDLGVAAHFTDRVAVMYLGRIVETGSTRAVLSGPQHPYTKALCDVVPRRQTKRNLAQASLLRGEADATGTAATAQGCRFRPRCRYAIDACAEEDPRLRPVEAGDGHETRDGHEAACIRPGLFELAQNVEVGRE